MRNARMRERLTIQAAADKFDEYGDGAPQFSDVAVIWARKVELSGRQFMQAVQVSTERTIVFETWNRKDISEKHRVKWGDKVLDIIAIVSPDSAGRKMEIRCIQRG